jgi:hypothetical protein
LGINLAEEARKIIRKVMERYSKNVKDKIKTESYMTKDKEEAIMLSEQKQPNNMKPFKVDESRAEMNHILNERADVIIMIKFEKGMMFRECLKKYHFEYHKQIKLWSAEMNRRRIEDLKKLTSFESFLGECKIREKSFEDDIAQLGLDLPDELFTDNQNLTTKEAMKLCKSVLEKDSQRKERR